MMMCHIHFAGIQKKFILKLRSPTFLAQIETTTLLRIVYQERLKAALQKRVPTEIICDMTECADGAFNVEETEKIIKSAVGSVLTDGAFHS